MKEKQIQPLKGGGEKMNEEQKAKLRKHLGYRKVFGRPKLPIRVDAMYDNQCRGNLIAYYLDADPVRCDPVHRKLNEIYQPIKFDESPVTEMTRYLMDRMKSREMDERTYVAVRDTPVWILKNQLFKMYNSDLALRERMDQEKEYMYRDEERRWTDAN